MRSTILRNLENISAIMILVTLLMMATSSQQANAMPSSNKTIHPYVLYFDGQLDIDSDDLSKIYDTIFEGLDKKRIISEKVILSTIGSHFYTLEAFIEAASDNDAEYVDNYVTSHPYLKIANTQIPLRQASKIIAVNTIKGFNGDGRLYGSFSKLIPFNDIGDYNKASFDTLDKLGNGSIETIRTSLPSLLSQQEAYNFNRWLDSLGSSQNQNIKITWHSNTFFEMDDGSYIGRALFFYVIRDVGNTTNDSRKGSALKDGFERR